MDFEGIKMLLHHADVQFPRLKHLWLEIAPLQGRGEGQGLGGKSFGLDGGDRRASEKARSRRGPESMGQGVVGQRGGEGRLGEALIPPKGFRVLPRRWVVERTFSWIDQNRRMSLGITKG